MSLPIMSFKTLNEIILEKTKAKDEEMINRIVEQVYDKVNVAVNNRLFVAKWIRLDNLFDENVEYQYKHVILAINRLKGLFPDTFIRHSRMSDIIIEWY